MTTDSFVRRQKDQSLSSLVKTNLQIHSKGDGDDNDDATNINLKAYLKWRKNEAKRNKQKQQHLPPSRPPRLEGLRVQVQNAERFVQRGKGRELIRNREGRRKQEADHEETASVSTHTGTTVASSSSSSSSSHGNGSPHRNQTTAAELVFSRPAPEEYHEHQHQQASKEQPFRPRRRRPRPRSESSMRQTHTSTPPPATNGEDMPSSFMRFLTAAMSATDEADREKAIASFGHWDQQQHESPQQRSPGNAFFGEEGSVESHNDSPLQHLASQPIENDGGVLWSAAKAVAGYATSMVGHGRGRDDTSDTSVSSSSGSSEETGAKGYSPSQSQGRPSLVELNDHSFGEESVTMASDRDVDDNVILREQQLPSPQQTRLSIVVNDKTTAMDFLSAAMASTDEDERKRIMEEYHAWREKQPNKSRNNSKSQSKAMAVVSILQKHNDRVTSDDFMDEHDREQILAEEGNCTGTPQQQQPQQPQALSLSLTENTTDPMAFLRAIMAAPDDNAKERALLEYQAQIEQEEEKEQLHSCENNTAMGFLTAAMVAPVDETKEQVLMECQVWAKNQEPLNNDSSNTAMAFSAAAMAAPDAKAKEAVLSDYHQCTLEQESHGGDIDGLYADDKCAESGVKRCIPRRRMVVSAFLLMVFATIVFMVARQVLRHHKQNYHNRVAVDAIGTPTGANGSNGKDLTTSENKHNTWTGVNMPSTPFGEKKFFLLDIPELTSELFLNYTKTNANRFYANADPLHRAEMWLHRGFERMTYKEGRTMDPKEADVFLIPAYLHWRSSLPVELDRQVAPMIQARLIDKTKPHVLLVPTTSAVRSSAIHLRPLASLLNKLDVNVYSVGFERNTFCQGLSTDRIIPIPHVVETSSRRLTSNEDSSSAAASNSNRTENFVFYAENALQDAVSKSGCDRSIVMPLQNRTDMDVRLLSQDDDPLSARDRYERMSRSEFCLVTCGNTPTTDTLAASVIAGCIPIRVGSRWDGGCEAPCHIGFGWNILSSQKLETHLPFHEQINWDSFPQVHEAAFAHDPLRTLQEVFHTMSSEDKQKLHAEMERARLSLIYGWGNPTASSQFGEVYKHIWKTIMYNIGLVEEEGW